MIVEYIRYGLTDHSFDQLSGAYAQAGAHLQAAPQCLSYELTRCEEAPDQVVVRIIWRSTEDHLQGFRKGPNFPPFLQLIRPFIGEIEEMRHYALTEVSWTRNQTA